MFGQPQIFTIDAPLTLYHGSLSGLTGKISVNYPKASARREFGQGFYTAATEEPAQRTIIPYDYTNLPDDYADPFLYELKADLSGLKGIKLSGFSWIMFAAYNRGYLVRETCPDFYSSLEEFFKNINLVIGPIADAKLFPPLQDFFNDFLPVEALNTCLKNSDSGIQYVFKNQKEADEQLEITKISRPDAQECGEWGNRESVRLNEWYKEYKNFYIKTRRSGRLLSELIEEINADNVLFPKPVHDASILKFEP